MNSVSNSGSSLENSSFIPKHNFSGIVMTGNNQANLFVFTQEKHVAIPL